MNRKFLKMQRYSSVTVHVSPKNPISAKKLKITFSKIQNLPEIFSSLVWSKKSWSYTFLKWISWQFSSKWLFQINLDSNLERAQTSEHCFKKIEFSVVRVRDYSKIKYISKANTIKSNWFKKNWIWSNSNLWILSVVYWTFTISFRTNSTFQMNYDFEYLFCQDPSVSMTLFLLLPKVGSVHQTREKWTVHNRTAFNRNVFPIRS